MPVAEKKTGKQVKIVGSTIDEEENH